MKKVILRIGITATTIIMVLGILYFLNGSLEMYPTDEQIQKTRISAAIIVIISFVVDIVLIRLVKKRLKWLFFDLGSTLLDESDCEEYRILDLLKQENAPGREIIEKKMKEYASKNGQPYKNTAKEYGLKTVEWPTHLEKVYEEVPAMLEKLKGKYKLGIIANQNMGTEERMKKYGIHSYFDVIISSAEEGVAKPDLEIFKRALAKAGCTPKEAYMIGDRLDNDIEPAAKLGMRTIWVKQGLAAYGDLSLINHKPDVIVEHIEDVLEYL